MKNFKTVEALQKYILTYNLLPPYAKVGGKVVKLACLTDSYTVRYDEWKSYEKESERC